MKYNDKVGSVTVVSDYPIEHKLAKKILESYEEYFNKAVITGPLADEDWEFGNTVGELIDDLKKLPKDMPVVDNLDSFDSMGVRNVFLYDYDKKTIYVHSKIGIGKEE